MKYFFKKRYSIVDILSRAIGIIIGLYIFSRYISPMM
uniref:Putative periplasmic lipoprotein n=1 Tax=Siphoviridae sp. ctVif31 TaxID=2825532 RepID=A0A8S5Q4T8_9CAUD|nr:MAG TPA: putative periplasmic lipoprotein [Siphoviridae sp. ctVif31]